MAGPGNVSLALGQRRADGVQALHEITLGAQDVQHRLAHAGHDAHVGGGIGGIGDLHADMGDVGAQRPHGERHHVHGAALHAALVQLGHARLHLARFDPVVGGAGIILVVRADEGAVLDARHVAGVGAAEIGTGTQLLVQLDHGAAGDHHLAQGIVFLLGTVADVDAGRTAQPRHLVDPRQQFGVHGGPARNTALGHFHPTPLKTGGSDPPAARG